MQGKQIITCDFGIVRSGAEALVSQGTKKSHSGARSSLRSRVLGGRKFSLVRQVVCGRSRLGKWVLGGAEGCVL